MTEEIRVEEMKEEVKEEIKQTNFRIKSDDADKFRKLCEELGINQAQGFSHLIQVIELNQAKETLTGQTTSIEEFEMHVKSIMNGYMQALELNANAEARAKEGFISQLESKDKSIMDYQVKLEKEKEKVTALEEKLKEYDALKKNQALLENELASKNQQIADKDNIIAMKNEKLDAAEEKVNAYDELFESKKIVDAALAAEQQKVKDAEAEMNKQLELSEARCEKTALEAVQNASEEWQKEMDKLRNEHQEELNTIRTEHQQELDNIRVEYQSKLDAEKESSLEKLEQQREKLTNKHTEETEKLHGDIRALERANGQLETKISTLAENYNNLRDEFTTYKKQNPSK